MSYTIYNKVLTSDTYSSPAIGDIYIVHEGTFLLEKSNNNVKTNKIIVSYNITKFVGLIILLQGFLGHLLCAARLLLRQPRFV